MLHLTTCFTCAAAVGTCVFLLWLISLVINDVSIVDIWWAPGFPLILWVAGRTYEPNKNRYLALLVLIGIWSLRLFVYLCKRNLGKGEDYRYQDIRRGRPNFRLSSLYVIFGLQGLLQLIIALPFYTVAASTEPICMLDLVGIFLIAMGLVIEAIADNQLTAFKAEPGNRGKVMDQGLWGWSRHPNYFGDAVIWAGIGLVGQGAGAPVWAWVGPALMWFLLLHVSGVALLESTIVKRRPEYKEYSARVPAFFPWPPRKARYL